MSGSFGASAPRLSCPACIQTGVWQRIDGGLLDSGTARMSWPAKSTKAKPWNHYDLGNGRFYRSHYFILAS